MEVNMEEDGEIRESQPPPPPMAAPMTYAQPVYDAYYGYPPVVVDYGYGGYTQPAYEPSYQPSYAPLVPPPNLSNIPSVLGPIPAAARAAAAAAAVAAAAAFVPPPPPMPTPIIAPMAPPPVTANLPSYLLPPLASQPPPPPVAGIPLPPPPLEIPTTDMYNAEEPTDMILDTTPQEFVWPREPVATLKVAPFPPYAYADLWQGVDVTSQIHHVFAAFAPIKVYFDDGFWYIAFGSREARDMAATDFAHRPCTIADGRQFMVQHMQRALPDRVERHTEEQLVIEIVLKELHAIAMKAVKRRVLDDTIDEAMARYPQTNTASMMPHRAAPALHKPAMAVSQTALPASGVRPLTSTSSLNFPIVSPSGPVKKLGALPSVRRIKPGANRVDAVPLSVPKLEHDGASPTTARSPAPTMCVPHFLRCADRSSHSFH